MKEAFGKLEIAPDIDSVTAVRELRAHFPKLSSIMYPFEDRKGAKFFGFEFFRHHPLLDWKSISTWCDTRRPPLVFLDDNTSSEWSVSARSFGDTRFLVDYIPRAVELKLPMRWDFYFRFATGKCFSADLEFSLGSGRILGNLSLSVDAFNESKEREDLIKSLWLSAIDRIDCMKEVSMEFESDAEGTRCILIDKANSKRTINRISCRLSDLNDAMRIFDQFWDWATPLSRMVNSLDEYVRLAANELVVEDVSRLIASNAQCRFDHMKYCGNYKKRFRCEEVGDRVTAEGFWEFPMFRFRCGKYEVTVFLIQTTSVRFFEFRAPWAKGEEDLAKYFKKNGIELPLEFWKDHIGPRWNLIPAFS